MEDLDSIVARYNESSVLNILDGVNSFEDVVFWELLIFQTDWEIE